MQIYRLFRMAKDKRNKSRGLLPNKTPQKEADYDLDKSFKKVSSYTRRTSRKSHQDQTTDFSTDNRRYQDRIVENNDELGNKTITDSWNVYTRLDDKLSSFSEKNDEAHRSLRQELEHKINLVDIKCDKKVSLSLFEWIIGGILTITSIIVTIWWKTSYEDVSKLPREVQNIHNRINILEEKNQSAQQQDTINAVNKYSK